MVAIWRRVAIWLGIGVGLSTIVFAPLLLDTTCKVGEEEVSPQSWALTDDGNALVHEGVKGQPGILFSLPLLLITGGALGCCMDHQVPGKL